MWMARIWKLMKTAGRDGLVLLHALRDPHTPRGLKLGILALGLYVLSPIDLVPDILMLFGWADDFAVLMFGIPFLARRLPNAVRARAEEGVDRWMARWRAAGRI